ncbi:MAG: ferrous iron transport protein A [Phycisphaerales bacterium]
MIPWRSFRSGPKSIMNPVSLSQLKRGQSGVVCSTSLAQDDAAMLGAMGLRCNAKVRLCREGEPCIVAVCSGSGVAACRIGLARPLADRIMVTPSA